MQWRGAGQCLSMVIRSQRTLDDPGGVHGRGRRCPSTVHGRRRSSRGSPVVSAPDRAAARSTTHPTCPGSTQRTPQVAGQGLDRRLMSAGPHSICPPGRTGADDPPRHALPSDTPGPRQAPSSSRRRPGHPPVASGPPGSAPSHLHPGQTRLGPPSDHHHRVPVHNGDGLDRHAITRHPVAATLLKHLAGEHRMVGRGGAPHTAHCCPSTARTWSNGQRPRHHVTVTAGTGPVEPGRHETPSPRGELAGRPRQAQGTRCRRATRRVAPDGRAGCRSTIRPPQGSDHFSPGSSNSGALRSPFRRGRGPPLVCERTRAVRSWSMRPRPWVGRCRCRGPPIDDRHLPRTGQESAVSPRSTTNHRRVAPCPQSSGARGRHRPGSEPGAGRATVHRPAP